MDFSALMMKIDSGAVPPILFLCGEENFLVQRALSALRKKVVTRAPDFNRAELDGKDDGVDKIVLAARTLPMMSEKRLIVASRADEIKGEGLQPLLTYAQDPAPQSVLVLLGKTLDQRTKLGQLLKSKDYFCDCVPLKRAALDRFVAGEAKAMGLVIGSGVSDLLFECYGTDLAQSILALERFALYLGGGGGGVVDETIAAPLLLRTRAESVFALTDAVIAGRASDALPLAAELAAQKESPIAMVALVARQIRQLIILREAIDAGASAQTAARTAGVAPFAADRFIARAQKTKLTTLVRAHAHLTEADARLKSSPLADTLVWFASLADVMYGESSGQR